MTRLYARLSVSDAPRECLAALAPRPPPLPPVPEHPRRGRPLERSEGAQQRSHSRIDRRAKPSIIHAGSSSRVGGGVRSVPFSREPSLVCEEASFRRARKFHAHGANQDAKHLESGDWEQPAIADEDLGAAESDTVLFAISPMHATVSKMFQRDAKHSERCTVIDMDSASSASASLEMHATLTAFEHGVSPQAR